MQILRPKGKKEGEKKGAAGTLRSRSTKIKIKRRIFAHRDGSGKRIAELVRGRSSEKKQEKLLLHASMRLPLREKEGQRGGKRGGGTKKRNGLGQDQRGTDH